MTEAPLVRYVERPPGIIDAVRDHFALTKVPERGSVTHAERMMALAERNSEMEFIAWAVVLGLAVLGVILRGRS